MPLYLKDKLVSGTGAPGKSAYEAAKAGGYTGTEASFNQALKNIPGHIADRENPHGVTAAQVGADVAGAANEALNSAKAYTDQIVAGVIPGDGSKESPADSDSIFIYDNADSGKPKKTLISKLVELFNNTFYTKTETNTLLQKKVNPNLLDNWYFANPVNQRGNTEYTGSGYTIDRFIQKVDSGVVQVTSNGIVLSGSDCLLHQIIEFSQDLIGETVTFSVLTANNHLYACTGTVTDSANTNFAVKFLDSSNSNIAIISDSSKRVIVQIRAMGGATYTVKAVKLELGSQQTLAHQDENGNWVLNEIPDYGEQLARCQRYFIELNPNNVKYNTVAVGVGWSGGTEVDFVIPIPTTMRANPTIVNLSNFHCVDTTDISWHNFTSANCYLGSGFIKMVGFIDASVSGRTYALMCDKNSLKMHLSADL